MNRSGITPGVRSTASSPSWRFCRCRGSTAAPWLRPCLVSIPTELIQLLQSDQVSPIALGLHSRRLLERLVTDGLGLHAERGSAAAPLVPDPAMPGRDISREGWLPTLLALQLLHLEPQLPENRDQQNPCDQPHEQQKRKQGDQPNRGDNSNDRCHQLLDPLRAATARQLLHGRKVVVSACH